MSEDCFEETTLVLSKVLKVVWYGLFRPLCTLCCNVLCFLVCNLLPPSDLKDPNYRKKKSKITSNSGNWLLNFCQKNYLLTTMYNFLVNFNFEGFQSNLSKKKLIALKLRHIFFIFLIKYLYQSVSIVIIIIILFIYLFILKGNPPIKRELTPIIHQYEDIFNS